MHSHVFILDLCHASCRKLAHSLPCTVTCGLWLGFADPKHSHGNSTSVSYEPDCICDVACRM